MPEIVVATVWFEFGAALLVIGVAGSRLARHGDTIGELTGLGGTWVGVVMIATVTSLPELVTGLSAVVLAEDADIAVGALLGSCVFNLVILVFLDLGGNGPSIYARVRRGHERTAAFSLTLLVVAGGGLLLSRVGHPFAVGPVGGSSLAVLALYLVFVRWLFRYERERMAVLEPAPAPDPGELRLAIWGYLVAAAAVVAAGVWLPLLGERLAVAMDVHETFVGTLLVAFATSLPEVVVTLSAVRIGAVNLAMSNLLGSNLFNVLLLLPEDLAFRGGPILAAVSPAHLISAAAAVVMTILVIAALRRPPQRRWLRAFGWPSPPLLLAYLATAYLLYRQGR